MTTEYQTYLDTLTQSHRVKVTVKVYDQNEDNPIVIDHALVTGQVDIDVNSDVERSASVTLADINNKILFGPTGGDVVLYADRFLSIEYVVTIDALNRDVVTPLFFGPITRFSSDGGQVTIEAQGKESLLQNPIVWGRFIRNSGLDSINENVKYAHQLIRELLRSCGEVDANFEFGTFENVRLPRNFQLPKQPENLWSVCKKIVQAANAATSSLVNHRIFYDGRGKVRVENMANGGYTFSDSPTSGVLLNKPTISYDLSSFANTVIVAVNHGQDSKPVAPVVASLADIHPLSPVSLSRNGKPRFIVTTLDNNNIRSRAHAKNLAEAELKKLSTESVEVSFDSLPIPHITPGSQCKLITDGAEYTFYADTFSIPLRASDSMSMGFQKRMQTGPLKPVHLHQIGVSRSALAEYKRNQRHERREKRNG